MSKTKELFEERLTVLADAESAMLRHVLYMCLVDLTVPRKNRSKEQAVNLVVTRIKATLGVKEGVQ